MNKLRLTVLSVLGIAAGMASSTVTAPAGAVTVPATAGHAATWTEATCFTSVWAGVGNTACGAGSRWYIVPVTFTPVAAVSTFRASSNFGGGIGTIPQCRLVVASANNGSVSVSGMAVINGVDIPVQSVAPTSSQSVQYECLLGSPPAPMITQFRW